MLSLGGPVSQWAIHDYNKTSDFHIQLLAGSESLGPPDVSPYIKENATISIGGLSYQATEVTDYLSIITLLIYVLLALGHFTLLLVTRQSSSSRNSLTELIALAYVSRPSQWHCAIQVLVLKS
jgi:hypothetical protein